MVELYMHKFGDICKSVLNISLFYEIVMFQFLYASYEIVMLQFTMEIMNCYVMLYYATVRWINGSVSHVIATTASDSRDEYMVITRVEMRNQLSSQHNNYVKIQMAIF